jgi:cytosine/adenosine deaminase-related metal-dependent hydrolase
MITLYSTSWVLPISSAPVPDGAIAVEGERIIAVGQRAAIVAQFPDAKARDFGEAVILPGLVNAHSHLELTAMRGFLEAEESDFIAWLKKLTFARLEKMSPDDLYVSAAWGACEAVRAGVTCLGDASDAAVESMKALRDVGLRGTVYQESFGPDPRLVNENLEKLKTKVSLLREHQTPLVRAGVSPHAPYTVCGAQLEVIADFAIAEELPLMMHAAESVAEDLFMREGAGLFADGLTNRGIQWKTPGVSTIQYLEKLGVLRTRPLLAHCINVDDADIETIKQTGARVAHCPKSNAKLGHGQAPFAKFLNARIAVGLGSDSVASNNTCDIFEEARFAVLLSRAGSRKIDDVGMISAKDALSAATIEGARALGFDGQIGELKAGLQADFVVVSLNGTHQLPSYDPVNALVFASSGRDVVMTVVGGREVFSGGCLTTVDEDRLRARMKEIETNLQR